MFVQMIFSEAQNILLPHLIWWCSIMSQSVMQTFSLLLLSSRSGSRQGLIWSKYDSFYYIFWTVDSLATKLGLMIHHHKPEYPVKKNWLLHSGSRSQWRVKMLVFVQIPSKPPNVLFPNLVSWCIIMSLSVKQKDWFAIFMVKVTAKVHMIKIWRFLILLYLLNCWSFCYHTWFDSTLCNPECFMEKLNSCAPGQGQSIMNECPDIFWIAEPFTTILGMVMHHYEPDCLSKRWDCCLQG